jgi:hypothetical protein
VRGRGDWLFELPGQAGLQRSDDRAILRPVRVEVEHLSKLLGVKPRRSMAAPDRRCSYLLTSTIGRTGPTR